MSASQLDVTFVADGEELPKQTGLTNQAGAAFGNSHKLAFRGWVQNLGQAKIEDSTTYDLVVVGAGVSGLVAAHRFKALHADAKILIIDPLVVPGGHAQRVEFAVEEKDTAATAARRRTVLSYGGSESLQSPSVWSAEALSVLKDIGVDLRELEASFRRDTYISRGMSRAVFMPTSVAAAADGQDAAAAAAAPPVPCVLATGDCLPMVADDLSGVPAEKQNVKELAAFAAAAFPADAAARASFVALCEGKLSFREGGFSLSSAPADADKNAAALAAISYTDYLERAFGLPAGGLVSLFFEHRLLDFFALASSKIPALDALSFGFPVGVAGVALPAVGAEERAEMEEPYVYHFPDGNATIARLLVHGLVPGAFIDGRSGAPPPQKNPAALLLAKLQLGALDSAANAVRIRQNHTVCAIAPAAGAAGGDGDGDDDLITVGYVDNTKDDSNLAVKTKRVICACFQMILPKILRTQECDAAFAAACKSNAKSPLIYTSVLLRQWRAFQALGAHEVLAAPGTLAHTRIKLDYPVDCGSEYRCSKDPNTPIVVHAVLVPTGGDKGSTPEAASRAARSKLFALGEKELTAALRADLTKLLGPTGDFDFDKDVLAINFSRSSHGYSAVYNSLNGVEEDEQDARDKLARTPHAGARITFANSDSERSAYLHSAIDAAFRAVDELKK